MANNVKQLYGDYSPDIMPGTYVTPYEGLKKLSSSVQYASGCNGTNCIYYNESEIEKSIQRAQLVVVCLGTGKGYRLFVEGSYFIFCLGDP